MRRQLFPTIITGNTNFDYYAGLTITGHLVCCSQKKELPLFWSSVSHHHIVLLNAFNTDNVHKARVLHYNNFWKLDK